MKKKFLLLSLVSIVVISCNKTFECNCDVTVIAINQGDTQTIKSNAATTITAGSRNKAQGTCNTFRDDTNKTALEDQTTGGVPGTEVDANTVCSLNEKK